MRGLLVIAALGALGLCTIGCQARDKARPAATPFASESADEVLADEWYRVAINGQPCGYARYRSSLRDAVITTTYEERVIESHGGQPLEMVYLGTWEETARHQPMRYIVQQRDGAAGVVDTYRFTPDHIERVSRQGDRQTTATLAHPRGDWLTPGQVDVVLKEAMAEGQRRIALKVYDPQIVDRPYTVIYDEPAHGQRVEIADGSRVEATRWRVAYSYLPGMPAYEYYDSAGVAVKYEIDMGGGAVVTRTLADASVAEAEFDPPEMADRSMVRPDRPIEAIGRVKLAVYELTFGDPADGPLGVQPPNTQYQRVARLGDRRVRLTIDMRRAPDLAGADPPGDAYLAASIAVDHTDPVVQGLTRRVAGQLKADHGPADFARAAELFVASHIRGGSLSVGSATASEAARTREGDCTESAVLLAAMLRARGIPSRCVYGLVYTEDPFLDQPGVFVYHMWTQAWVSAPIPADDPNATATDGYWMEVDAAMLGYTAGHLALGLTAMGENADAEALRLVPMTADLAVKVIRIER
ncbi:MAG: transglutaminase-like domain-containing protein [Planctomycetota bacterium]